MKENAIFGLVLCAVTGWAMYWTATHPLITRSADIQRLEQQLRACEDGAEDLPRLLRAEERRLNEREANFR